MNAPMRADRSTSRVGRIWLDLEPRRETLFLINIGLPILECPDAVAGITEGDLLEVDLSKGSIRNRTTGAAFQALPLPDFVLKIAAAGGIVNFLKDHDIQELVS